MTDISLDTTLGPAKLSDLDAIWQLYQTTFPSSQGHPWVKMDFFNYVQQEDPHRLYVVKSNESAMVAFVAYRRVLDEIEIDKIATRPDYRRRGLAKQLLDALLNGTFESSVVRISLEVRRDNPAAIRLYMQCGFNRVGTRKRYYPDGEDAIVMSFTRR